MSINLWILTEEKPKDSVVMSILKQYADDFNKTITSVIEPLQILPNFDGDKFAFTYKVKNITIQEIYEITVAIVSGYSSFFDFLITESDEAPTPENSAPIMAIEETKTSDEESRNTGVYQRATKFPFIKSYYPNVRLYMLYNEELQTSTTKKPSDTSIFGTNTLLSTGVMIQGKDLQPYFNAFTSNTEMINFKNAMRQPPEGNVPINIAEYPDRVEISGRLAKPANGGNIGHDPNIGALSLISSALRTNGCTKPIVITQHAVSQRYVDSNFNNKFLYICKILNMTLEGLSIDFTKVVLPEHYWYYESKSEKIASIFLHIIAENNGMSAIYHNHAGCERGYFVDSNNQLIALPKKDNNGVNLYLPDLVLHDPQTNTVVLIEGKQLSTLNAGIKEIELYDSIEDMFIKPNYPSATIVRYISIFGGSLTSLPHDKVLLYMANDGSLIVNPNAPACIKRCF